MSVSFTAELSDKELEALQNAGYIDSKLLIEEIESFDVKGALNKLVYDSLIAKQEKMVMTNIGEMPKEDYDQIALVQNGFSSQEEVEEEALDIKYGDTARCHYYSLVKDCTIYPNGVLRPEPVFNGVVKDYIAARAAGLLAFDYLHRFGKASNDVLMYNILKADSEVITIQAAYKSTVIGESYILSFPTDELNAWINGNKTFGDVILNDCKELEKGVLYEHIKNRFCKFHDNIINNLGVPQADMDRLLRNSNYTAMGALLNANRALISLSPSCCFAMSKYERLKDNTIGSEQLERDLFSDMARWALDDCQYALSVYDHAAFVCERYGIKLNDIKLDEKAEIIRTVKKFTDGLSFPVCIGLLIKDAELAKEHGANVPFRHDFENGEIIEYESLRNTADEIDIGIYKEKDGVPSSNGTVIEIRKSDFKNPINLNFAQYLKVAMNNEHKTKFEREL